jgi:hypothetical protein
MLDLSQLSLNKEGEISIHIIFQGKYLSYRTKEEKKKHLKKNMKVTFMYSIKFESINSN